MRLRRRTALTAALLQAALPSLARAAPAATKELKLGRPSSIAGLDPGFLREPATVVDNIFDTLLMRDAAMKLIPGLALSWTAIDDQTWEFRLRPGVTFHNGENFTADAVKFSLERVLDPAAKSPTVSYIRTIDTVTVVDPATVRIRTHGPDPLLPTRMSRYPAYIVPPGYVKSVGPAEFARKPVGSGAYRFVEFIPDQHVVLEAAPGYWRGTPAIGRVIWRPIPDDMARMTALLTGEVDLIENVPADLAAMLQSNGDVDLVQVRNGGLTIYFGLVTGHAPLDNLKVRQALDHAIDRKGIVDNILHGMATVKGTQVGPADFGYVDIPPPAYDPKRAKALLAEAGFPDGFAIRMQASHRYMKDTDVAQAVAQQLGEIGVKVQLEILEWSVYLQQVPRQGPIYMLGWGSTATLDADAAIYPIFHTGEPYSTASFPDIDKLLDQTRATVDPAQRAAAFRQLQEIAAQEVPVLTLYQEDALYGRRKGVGFKGRADARIPVFDITME